MATGVIGPVGGGRTTDSHRNGTRALYAGRQPPDMVEIGFQQIGLELGTGAVIGGLIGFTAKKVAKVIAVLVGLQLALFKFLESREILSVDWSRLSAGLVNASETAGGAATANQPPGLITSFLSVIPVSAGFTGGFLLGFRRG